MAMANPGERNVPDRNEGEGERSDGEGRETLGMVEGTRDDVAVIPDADDLEERYRLLRELRGLGRCVGLEG
jgi:hypothetical protein